MPVLREIIEVEMPVDAAFAAVADFSTSERWDPGVVKAHLVKPGAAVDAGVGAAYALTVTFRGRPSDMTYTTTTYDPPHRVVLEGVGPRIKAIDTIEFERTGVGGTRITYTADLQLIGVAKVAGPFLGGAFAQLGKDAISGMRSWLGSGADGS